MEDPSIPEETRIYYSKPKALIWLALSTAMVSSLIWLAFTDNKSYLAVVIFGSIFSFILFTSIRKLRTKKPYILLNATGIQAGKLPFYKWKDIDNEQVITKIQRGPARFLKYDSPSGTNKFFINDLDIDYKKLETLLASYRVRSSGSS